MGTFLTNYTCSVAPGRRLVSVVGAPLPGTGATPAGSTPRARTERRPRRALPRSEERSRRGGMPRVAGTGHSSNPPSRRRHGLAGGALSGSLHGGGRTGRRQTPRMGKFTWSRTHHSNGQCSTLAFHASEFGGERSGSQVSSGEG
jgi:hypothetical protein